MIRGKFILVLMTLISFCMSTVLAQDCLQTCNVCLQPPCTFCPGHFVYTPDLSTSELIFEVYSPMSVSSGPADTSFTIPEGRTITDIGTYHWYGQGGAVGTIGLQNVDSGTMYGPWQASGYAGMNGAQNVYWVVSPYVYLPAGTYKIVDSDQSTWSYTPNDCTGSEGHCWVFAEKETSGLPSTPSNSYSGEAISKRSGKTYPFKLTLIGPDMDSSINGQIEWTSLNSIHQIVGSKTTTGITFTETAYIKKGGAVLNCKYYLNSEGNSFTGTWDSCDDGDYGTISMKTE